VQNKKLVKPLFCLLAGEASGDNLGAALIKSLKETYPDASFAGIGSRNMIGEGLESWVDMDRLSVNGFVDPFLRLPSLLNILLSTRNKILLSDCACFIGIDFNFFNLLLAGMLKKRGIRTVHYVSPTVWAWRKGRIKSIARKIDLMLTLYPFELDIYHQNNIDAEFVGHPKADEIGLDEGSIGKLEARKRYQLEKDEKVVAILPGSRGSEVAYSAPDFLAAAKIIRDNMQRQNIQIKFLIPAINEKRKLQIQSLLNEVDLPLVLAVGDARNMMLAADVVLVNSGTATLEAMLLKRPMVMSYKLGALTYAIVSRMITSKYLALPNILSQKPLVPELIQNDATPEALSSAIMKLLNESNHSKLLSEFEIIHKQLQKNAAKAAAVAISQFVEGHRANKIIDV